MAARATIKGEGRADRRFCRIGRHDRSEGLRQERQRQRDCRGVRLAHRRWCRSRPSSRISSGGSRRTSPPNSEASPPLHQATSGVRMAGKVPVDARLLRRAGGPDRLGRTRRRHGMGRPRRWSARPSQRRTGKPRLFGEYNYASGDADRTDGTRGTFDQLYPTGHDKLGLSDQVGWRNIHNATGGHRVQADAEVAAGGQLSLVVARQRRPTASTARAARSWRDRPPARPGRHVGQEIDGQVSFAYSPQLQIGGGYAHLVPGEFLKNTTPGRSTSPVRDGHVCVPRRDSRHRRREKSAMTLIATQVSQTRRRLGWQRA